MSTNQNIAEGIPGRSVKLDKTGTVIEATREFQVLRMWAGLEPKLNQILGLPAIGSAHPVYTGIKVLSYEMREDSSNGRRWLVTVLYGQEQASADVTGSITARVIRVSYDDSETQRDLVFDANTGDPLLNTAGDPFETVPQVAQSDPMVRIERQDNLTPGTVMALNGTVNDTAVTIQGIAFDAYAARLTISGERIENPTYAYNWVYTITGRTKQVVVTTSKENIGWQEAVVHTGYYYLDGTTRKRAMELEEGSTTKYRPTARPVLLDADGAKATTPYVQVYQAYPVASWTSLYLNL